MVEEFSAANTFSFCVNRLYSNKKLNLYATMDNLKEAQSYLDYTIKRSEMKYRPKRAVRIVRRKKDFSFSIMMVKSM